MSTSITAVLDACVLYPAPLRDLLMQLAMTGIYRARWTAQIHDEWIRNVLAVRPDLNASQLRRTRQLMDAHVLDCLVTGHEKLIDGLTLPDPDDRHVLAAAIRANATVIVTFNLRDFPAETLAALGVEARHPDKFVTHLIDLDSELVCTAVRRQRLSLRNPSRSAIELLDTFAKQGLSGSARKLTRHIDVL